MIKRYRRQIWFKGCAALSALLGVAAAGPAFAQAWIGELAARISAERASFEKASLCQAGIPWPAEKQAKIEGYTTQLLASYFALTSAADKKALAQVFAIQEKTSFWQNAAGRQSFETLGARLDDPEPKLTRSAFIVSGDGQSARGLWRIEGADPASKEQVYLIDFVYAPSGFVTNGWHIWHMSILPDSPEALAMIYPYCKFESDIPDNMIAVVYGAAYQPPSKTRQP